MYYDPEANKYGAGSDYNQFDNTMAFSDVSIRAGKSIFSVLNPKEIKFQHYFSVYVTELCFFFSDRVYTKGKLP